MNQTEKRRWLIDALLSEQPRYRGVAVPEDARGQKDLLRSLMNVRMPAPLSAEYVEIEDAYLRGELAERGITRLEDLTPVDGSLYLWQGDITTISCDAIVNAANSQLLGCFRPLHNCVDNCIHSAAGLRLRNACSALMEAQGCEEPPGRAKITPAGSLPCRYVIHTVGPIVDGQLTDEHRALLASCYHSCLDLAAENGCESVAFCAISTGVFGFPKEPAAQIAVSTARAWLRDHDSSMKVIFTAFSDSSLAIYRKVLQA